MNRKICFSLIIAAACSALVVAQTVTPTLANAKLHPPLAPIDVVPPAVVSIAAQSGAPGTPAMPIAVADPIIITFSKPVTAASLDLLTNFVVRNQNVTTAAYPLGILVPGFITPMTPGATNDAVYVFTPIGPYGPGVSPAQGFDIEVRIGSFGSAAVAPILGLPMGAPPLQLPLSNSLSQVFRTTPCVGCVTPAAIGETFDTTSQYDASHVQTFGGQTRWNHGSAPSQLAGRLLAGSPSGNTPSGLGSRFQIVFIPQPQNAVPAGLFAPFDASAASSGGQCGAGGCNLGINPQGGSHLMHLYEAVDLLNTEESLEQLEWSPVNSVTAATVYPQYRLWCGVTNHQGAYSGAACPPPNPVNLCMTSIIEWNYTLAPYQSGQPISGPCANPMAAVPPRKVLCNGPAPYVVALATTQWYAFPVLAPCFDYSTSTGQSGLGVNLLIEQNIEPGPQLPNFNRYRATANTPVRRLIDGPLSQVQPGICSFNHGGGFDIYNMRFTFVGLVAQGRSLWYDTGTSNPNYLGFLVSPPLSAQPGGTQSTWILEGTDAANPGPGTNGAAGIYIDAAGIVHPNVLTSVIAQLRYFRFRVELRGNNLTNMAPSYGSVLMGYTF